MCQSMLVSKVKCGETLEYWILYYCDSGHSQVTLDTLTCPIHVPLSSLAFYHWLLTLPSLLVLYGFAIKMCSLDMTTEYRAKTEVFGVRPLYDPLLAPLHLNLTSGSWGTEINTASKFGALVWVFIFSEQRGWTRGSVPLWRILCLNSHYQSLRIGASTTITRPWIHPLWNVHLNKWIQKRAQLPKDSVSTAWALATLDPRLWHCLLS